MIHYSDVIAFDYHPSASDMLIDHWRHISAAEITAEMEEIKARHPEFNAVRLTHSYEAYQRSPKQYCRRFEELLSVADSLGWQVISCLFNRFHDARRDCGGTYLEQLIPDFSWAYSEGYYERFIQDVCLDHAEDKRILVWETCNKPLGVYRREEDDPIRAILYEKRWLREIYCYLKKCDVPQQVGISFRQDYQNEIIQHLKRCCDILIVSPYYNNKAMTGEIGKCDFSAAAMPVLRMESLEN